MPSSKTLRFVQQALSWKMLVILLLGFSSGLPLALTGSTLRAWMTDAKVDLSTIGLFTSIGLPYTLKFLWAPFLDRYIPPFLGRRRGWILIFQFLLMAGLSAIAFLNPQTSLYAFAILGLAVAFFSASQDIVIDAHRREFLATGEELKIGSSMVTVGYQIGMLFAGAFALFLADHASWRTVYLVMAAAMLVGVLTNLSSSEPDPQIKAPQSLKAATLDALKDYFRRKGAVEILLFLLFYKLGDAMAGAMTIPVILKIGFTKTEIAWVVKTFGIFATIGGGLLGGFLLVRLGLLRALFLFGILQLASTAAFGILSAYESHHILLAANRVLEGVSKEIGKIGISSSVFGVSNGFDKSHFLLMFAIAFENFSSGMGSSAFLAFIANLCNKRFTAFQYALLSSLTAVARTVLATPTGKMAKSLGWEMFFTVCALVAIPGLLLLVRYRKWETQEV